MKAEEFKALPHVNKIRTLSGIFFNDEEDLVRSNNALISRLALICLITRVIEGDADESFLNDYIDKCFPK